MAYQGVRPVSFEALRAELYMGHAGVCGELHRIRKTAKMFKASTAKGFALETSEPSRWCLATPKAGRMARSSRVIASCGKESFCANG